VPGCRVKSNSIQSSPPESFLILLFRYWRPLIRCLPRDFHFFLSRCFPQLFEPLITVRGNPSPSESPCSMLPCHVVPVDSIFDVSERGFGGRFPSGKSFEILQVRKIAIITGVQRDARVGKGCEGVTFQRKPGNVAIQGGVFIRTVCVYSNLSTEHE